MRYYASLSAEYLKTFADKTHRLMKCGRLPKVIKAAGISP